MAVQGCVAGRATDGGWGGRRGQRPTWGGCLQTFLKPPSGSSKAGSGSRCLRGDGPPSEVLGRRRAGRQRGSPQPCRQPKPFPANPVPGVWAAVGRLRLLPLRVEVGFSLMPGGESGPPPCLQGPLGPHPSPLQGPSTPCRLCDAPWWPVVPAPARQAPLLGGRTEISSETCGGASLPAGSGSLA